MSKFIKIKDTKCDGVLYENERLNIIESVIPRAYETSHACDLLELSNGDLLCAWFAGSDEGNSDISIVFSRLNKDEKKWTSPKQLSDNNGYSEQNPSLFLHPNGEIWAMYTAQKAKKNDENFNLQFTSQIYRKVSNDNGYTWSKPILMFGTPGSFCRQKIQILENGRFLFGNWMCFDDDSRNGSDVSVVYKSDDQGETWEKIEIPNSRGRVHLNIVEVCSGKIIGLMRSRAADYIYYTESLDNGDSWSEPIRTELPNNNSSISSIKLASGRIAVVYNDLRFNELDDISVWPYERTPVTVAISEDDGRSWPYRRIVEFGDGFSGLKNRDKNRRFEYPCIVQLSDNKLAIAYSYRNRESVKVVFVDEKWILGEL